MNQQDIKNKNIASGIAIIMLLLAIPSGLWPYSYYTILRWVITGIALFLLLLFTNLNNKKWSWIAIIIAILFNPILPFYLDKGTWVVIDFVITIIFLIFIFKIKKDKK